MFNRRVVDTVAKSNIPSTRNWNPSIEFKATSRAVMPKVQWHESDNAASPNSKNNDSANHHID